MWLAFALMNFAYAMFDAFQLGTEFSSLRFVSLLQTLTIASMALFIRDLLKGRA